MTTSLARWGPLAVLSLGACAPDLPDGWDDADPVDDFVQSPCAGSPYDGVAESILADAGAATLEVELTAVPFRCDQEVEAFVRNRLANRELIFGTDQAVDLLVQPRDMDPNLVAKCDCLYDLSVSLDALSAGEVQLAAFRRGDNHNSENDPVLIGVTLVEIQ